MQEYNNEDRGLDTKIKVDRAVERLRERETPEYAQGALNEYEKQLLQAQSEARIAKLKLGIERWQQVVNKLKGEK